MKLAIRLIISILVLNCIPISIVAQDIDYSFNYQAVIRDIEGVTIANEKIKIRIGIIQTDIGENPIYSEEFETITNQFGLVNLKIGNGDVEIGNFEEIKWGEGPFFLKLEIFVDIDYETIGISQLSSVPFAMYANNAKHADVASSVENLDYSSITNAPKKLSDLNNDLVLSGFTISNDSLIIDFNDSLYKVDLSDYRNSVSLDTATLSKNGLFTKDEKKKLIGIERNANNYSIQNDLVNNLTSNDPTKALTSQQGTIINQKIISIENSLNLISANAVYYSSVDNSLITKAQILADFTKKTKSASVYQFELITVEDDKYMVFVLPANIDSPSFYYSNKNHSLFKVFDKTQVIKIAGKDFSVWISNERFPASKIVLKL